MNQQRTYEQMAHHMATCVKNGEDMTFATAEEGETITKTYDVEIVKEVLPTVVKNLTNNPTTRLLSPASIRHELEKRASTKKEVFKE